MDEKLKESTVKVLEKIRANMNADEYLKLSQAVLNLAQAAQIYHVGETVKQ